MATPTHEYRRTSCRKPDPLLKGLDAVMLGFVGRHRRRSSVLGKLKEKASRVVELEKDLSKLTDHNLQVRLLDAREAFRRGGGAADEALIPALAAIREASRRQLGLHPFPVQIMGAMAMHDGCLAEMATGEGKTLTAGLNAILWGWTRRPCHIITVNDYLVQRDAEWLGPLYRFCGVRVGCVTAQMNPQERQKGYGCDVTYVTSKEVIADFLRDALQLGRLRQPTRRLIHQLLLPGSLSFQGVVMRGLHSAIVDEADSILIDEAVTPLIISTMKNNDALRDVVRTANQIVEPLQPETDYVVDHRYRDIELTKSGLKRLDDLCSPLTGIWQGSGRRVELVRQALVAREFYQLGKQYILDEGRVVIVDEFTGRPMPQRSWRQGMHQAIEAKEGVNITDPKDTVARLSFQRFFRYYYRLAGMTGTAKEAAGELWHIYRLPVIAIPPNRPCLRIQKSDRFFGTAQEKWEAVVEEIERVHGTGQPVLVGTRSVAASEHLAGLLTSRGLPFHILNAVKHKEEATVVAVAGEKGRITIATNMAGRGTDIRLGDGVAELGGLHVIATERHESGRVDRQLFGRSARQGDPGSAQAFLSAEDDLFRRFLPAPLRRYVASSLAVSPRGWSGPFALAVAQRAAQRQAFKMRKGVLRTDDWMDEALGFAGSNEV